MSTKRWARWVLGVAVLVALGVAALVARVAWIRAEHQRLRSLEVGRAPVTAPATTPRVPVVTAPARQRCLTGVVGDAQRPGAGFVVSVAATETQPRCGCPTACWCATGVEVLTADPREALVSAAQSAQTDEAGRFVLCGVGEPVPQVWAEHADGRVALSRAPVRLDAPLTLEVVRVRPRRGLVVDGENTPVPDARLVLYPDPFVSLVEAKTSRDGVFEATLPVGALRALVIVDGVRPALVTARVDEGSLVVLRLVRTSSLVVRAVSREQPTSGAQVSLDGESPATTNAEGEARFANVPSGTALDVRVTKDRLLGTAMVELRAGLEQRLDVVLEPGVQVRGSVVDEAGQPRLGRVRQGGALLDTDAQGRFASELVARQSEVSFTPEVEGCVAIETTRVSVGEVDETALLRVRCEVTLAGQVVDAEGAPIVGAKVRGSNEDTSEATLTDARGRFELAMPSGAAKVEVTHPRYRAQELPVTVPARELTVVLDAGASVRGRVVDRTGAGVAGAEVSALQAVVDGAALSMNLEAPGVDTDADGAFELSGLLAGRWVLAVTGTSVPPTPSEPLMLSPGEHREGVVVTVDGEVGLRGVVRDERRQPVVGASVRWAPVNDDAAFASVLTDLMLGRVEAAVRRSPSDTTTGLDGRFELRAVAEGAMKLEVTAEGFRAAERTVERGQDVELTLERARGLVRGRVVEESGRVVQRFVVSGRDVSAVDGRFEVQVADKETSLDVSAPGFVATTVQVTLEGPQVDVGEVKLRKGRSVEVEVVGVDGKPIDGARVAGVQVSGDSFSLRTGSTGRCTISPLLDGEAVLIKVRKEGFVPAEETVEPERLRAKLVFTLAAAGGRIEGTVFAAPGRPAAARQVFVPTAATSHFALTNTEGRFEFTGVPDGSACVSVELSGLIGAEWAVPVAVSSRSPPVTLGPVVNGGAVERRSTKPGRLVLLAGAHEPFEPSSLTDTAALQCELKKTAVIAVVAVGSTRVEGVPPGTWSVYAWDLGQEEQPVAPKLVTVSPGGTVALD